MNFVRRLDSVTGRPTIPGHISDRNIFSSHDVLSADNAEIATFVGDGYIALQTSAIVLL